jgi:hypothetical protein
MGELIDLDHERRMRAPPCPECGLRPSPPPDPDRKWRSTVDMLLCLDDYEAEWVLDPEDDPRLHGDPELDRD